MSRFLAISSLILVASLAPMLISAQESAVQNIQIGRTALDIKITGGLAYVTNPAEGVISVIDTDTKQVVDTISSRPGVLFLEVAPDRNKLYATVEGQNIVLVYDLQTRQQIAVIDLGHEQIVRFSTADAVYGEREVVYFATSGVGMSYNNNDKMLYVIHSEINHVKVVDTNTNQVVGSIPVGITPVQIAIDETTNTAYVTNWESNNLTIIDLTTSQVQGTLHTGFVPTRMVIDQQNRMLYVSHLASPHVTAVNINDNTISQVIPLKAATHALALDREAGLLHVTYRPDSPFTGQAAIHRVEFIDTTTNSLVSGIDIPSNPYQIRMGDDKQLFGTVIRDGTVFAVDLPNLAEYQSIIAKAESGDFGGGCLVATAAYGTELAPQVQLLREVRGNMMGTGSGAAFMGGFNSLYYAFSPTVADWERSNPAFKELVKITITPMLSTLSILNYVDLDSEQAVLGYGIGLILLNIGIYFAIPTAVILKIRSEL